jgi:hypothetical protein
MSVPSLRRDYTTAVNNAIRRTHTKDILAGAAGATRLQFGSAPLQKKVLVLFCRLDPILSTEGQRWPGRPRRPVPSVPHRGTGDGPDAAA